MELGICHIRHVCCNTVLLKREVKVKSTIFPKRIDGQIEIESSSFKLRLLHDECMIPLWTFLMNL